MRVLAKLKNEEGLWLSESDVPQYGPQEVLIKINKTAVYGTDLQIYQRDEWATSTIPVPMHVGHEFVGEVVDVGTMVRSVKVGDRVSGEGYITCNICRNYRAAKRHLCRNTQGVGVHRPGAFAEYLVLPKVNIIAIPDSISDNEAAVLDPFGNAVHTALAFDLVGEDVLITGAGPVGLMSAAIARHVVITDVNDYLLSIARSMGLTRAVNTAKEDLTAVMSEINMREGFDVGMEMSGHPLAFHEMLSVMNHSDSIAFLGISSKPFEINWSTVVFNSLTIKGIYGRWMFETWYKGMAMLMSGLCIDSVITDVAPVDDFQSGINKMLAGQAGKVILDWT